jgi:diguanylate cyclase (GGDEF)-like protein
MRDARLAELALLSELNARGQIRFQFADAQAIEKAYGLSQEAFKEMLMYLVMEGLVNGEAKFTRHGINGGSIANSQDIYLSQDIDSIYRTYGLDAIMNHRGRLRLQQLRDELRSSRTREPFGILYSEEYRERDLEIAFAFLPAKQSLSVLFMDLDNFKGVNDSKGHDVGDEVMRTYLQIVHDLSERFGEAYRGRGDEVTVILPQVDGVKAQEIAEAIRARIDSEFKEMAALATLAKKPTASIGAATCAAPARADDLFTFVDVLMYDAKNAGKNRVAWKAFSAPM